MRPGAARPATECRAGRQNERRGCGSSNCTRGSRRPGRLLRGTHSSERRPGAAGCTDGRFGHSVHTPCESCSTRLIATRTWGGNGAQRPARIPDRRGGCVPRRARRPCQPGRPCPRAVPALRAHGGQPLAQGPAPARAGPGPDLRSPGRPARPARHARRHRHGDPRDAFARPRRLPLRVRRAHHRSVAFRRTAASAPRHRARRHGHDGRDAGLGVGEPSRGRRRLPPRSVPREHGGHSDAPGGPRALRADVPQGGRHRDQVPHRRLPQRRDRAPAARRVQRRHGPPAPPRDRRAGGRRGNLRLRLRRPWARPALLPPGPAPGQGKRGPGPRRLCDRAAGEPVAAPGRIQALRRLRRGRTARGGPAHHPGAGRRSARDAGQGLCAAR